VREWIREDWGVRRVIRGGYAVDVGGESVADGFVVGAPYVGDVAAWCGFVGGDGVIGGGRGRGHDVDQFELWGPLVMTLTEVLSCFLRLNPQTWFCS
jgi:hypothetical protein